MAPRLTKAEREAQERKLRITAVEREAIRKVGQRISQARREAGFTQRQLADHLGITETMVSSVERGLFSPYKYLGSISDLIGKDREWFLHGTDGVQGDDIKAMLREIIGKLDHLAALMEKPKRR